MRFLNAFATNSLRAEAGDTAALCFTTAALTRRSDAGWNKRFSANPLTHVSGRIFFAMQYRLRDLVLSA
jgi:hypothetical protein